MDTNDEPSQIISVIVKLLPMEGDLGVYAGWQLLWHTFNI